MAQEVKVPKLGDNIEAAEVVAVLVSIGDTIEEGQSLIELESDKASVEVPSTQAGVVKELRVSVGDKVGEDQVILVLEAGDGKTAEAKGDAKASGKKATKTEAPDNKAAEADADVSDDKSPEAEAEASGSEGDEAEPAEAQTEDSASSASQEVRVPKLGDNIDAAEVTNVLVAVGDTIEAGQGLIELESDKASVEVPSPQAGVITSLSVKVGDSVSEDQLILVLKGQAKAASAPKAKPAAKSEPKATAKSESKSQAKAAVKTEAKGENASKPSSGSAAEPFQPASGLGNPAPAAPSVRRFARELGVDIHLVKGSGPAGRISVADVQAYVKQQLQAPQPAAASGAASLAVPDMPDFSKYGEISSEKLSNVRRATARQMSLSWSQIPHVTQFDSADITDAETFRKAQGKRVEAAGGKLTVTAILLKLVAIALKRFPQFNASIDLKNEQIIYKQYVHVGVAVDTPRGLVVPVLRDVDQKGLIALAVELGELGKKARDKKLSMDDMSGAGFTISNLGGLGTTYFTPIVNWPEVAILGVGRASTQPVWQDGAFVPRMIMPLSISYDHRLIDGADAARFLRFLAEALENPFSLLME